MTSLVDDQPEPQPFQLPITSNSLHAAPNSARNHHLVPFPSKLFKPNKLVELCIDNRHPNRGRAIFSKSIKPIKPGAAVLSLSPHVAVLDTLFLSSRCSSCFLQDHDFNDPNLVEPTASGPARQIRRCAKCKTVAYCGANCQRLDWASHKRECAALINYADMAAAVMKASQKSKSRSGAGYAPDGTGFGEEGSDAPIASVPSASVRALGRLIWNKDREEEKDPNWWIGLGELQNQLHAYNPSQKERLMQLSVTLSRYVGSQTLLDVLASASALLPFCCRFLDNSFTLTSTTLDHIGVILCPSASFINHSCAPNVVVVFPEGGEGASKKAGKEWVKVIAIKKIDPGEEIVTSYVDLAGTRKERQNDLAQRYQFICDCVVCKSDDPDEIDPREALKCPKCTNWFSLPRQSLRVHPSHAQRKLSNNLEHGSGVDASCNYHDVGQVPPPVSFDSVDVARSIRLDAGPSSSAGAVKKEVVCPSCGFSRLIDVEGQRLAIKKSGQALDAVKEPAKAAYYAEKAIEWFQIKLLPFTFGPGFYPILDLRRMKMASGQLGKRAGRVGQARAETQETVAGVHLVYGVGHPVSIITKATVTRLWGWGPWGGPGTGVAEEGAAGVERLERLREYQCLAVEECLVGFGSAAGGGRLGRSIGGSIVATEVEIEARRKALGLKSR